jgi:8-oxo-dGTP pyrophosphatase MutT (NUDIX family)
MTPEPRFTDGVVTLRPVGADEREEFAVEVGAHVIGTVALRQVGASTGEITFALDDATRGRGYATRAVRLLVDYAFGSLGLGRVQARVGTDNTAAVRVARRAGLRNEGVVRVPLEVDAGDYALLGRLREDPSPTEHGGFRALLNSFLPRKRVIAQALVRDETGRVLMCHPTYKDDWDLPGGVVEVRESPREAAAREVLEELGLHLSMGRLVLADWLPPWGGWDDAMCLVFDAGIHPVSVLDRVVLQAREIRETAFCTTGDVHIRAADYTARRVDAALLAIDGAGAVFTESGRTP